MKAVILAAGVGSRLGSPYPKCLSKLPDGETILRRQVRILRENNINQVYIVVGFKMTIIMEHVPGAFFKYNPIYYISNTSKSLLAGLTDLDDDVIWMNGDVIFDSELIQRVAGASLNAVAVNTSICGEEEIKYSTDEKGHIKLISKGVSDAKGEAVGINKITKGDLPKLCELLKKCENNDYFEKAVESAAAGGMVFQPIDISDLKCIEIDFTSDFSDAIKLFFDQE